MFLQLDSFNRNTFMSKASPIQIDMKLIIFYSPIDFSARSKVKLIFDAPKCLNTLTSLFISRLWKNG